MRVFHKYAHKYEREYELEVYTLGHEIMEWWSEICPPGGVPSVRFGGPTGVYSLVVLMTWWCVLLKSKPDEEHADCLRTLTDIDRVLMAAINGFGNRSTTSTPMFSPTPSQLHKRVNTEELLPRKRGRA